MKKLSMRAVVLSISLLTLSPTAVSPAVADMIAAFPEVNPSLVMWVVTLPSIAMVVFSLVYGGLVRFMSKRSLIAIAMACVVAGGIGPTFLDSIMMILVMRGIFGIGIGFILPLSTGIIADFYEGEDRAAMMGWQSAVVNFGGLIFMFLGGLLAAIYWNYTFLTYSIALMIAIWVLVKLPEPDRKISEANIDVKIPTEVYCQIAGVFLFNLLFFVIMTNTSVMISSEGLGSAALSGTVLTVFMSGGLCGGILFGLIVKSLGSFTNSAGWLATGLGLLIISFSHTIFPIIIGAFISGLGMATTMPSYLIRIASATPPSSVSMAYAYTFCFVGIGQFMSPPIFELINNLFNREFGRFSFTVSAAVILAVALTGLLRMGFKKRIP